ncbi:hypothetical protein Q73_13475 [Bacillus coahuilensis m2-6]|nr:hypothetical protein Q73_13475 [Bacillus coahuilensis m2-6]
MIGLFLEQRFVGIYQTAWQISSAVLMVGKSVTSVSFPHLSGWASENKWYKIKENIKKSYLIYYWFLFLHLLEAF